MLLYFIVRTVRKMKWESTQGVWMCGKKIRQQKDRGRSRGAVNKEKNGVTCPVEKCSYNNILSGVKTRERKNNQVIPVKDKMQGKENEVEDLRKRRNGVMMRGKGRGRMTCPLLLLTDKEALVFMPRRE